MLVARRRELAEVEHGENGTLVRGHVSQTDSFRAMPAHESHLKAAISGDVHVCGLVAFLDGDFATLKAKKLLILAACCDLVVTGSALAADHGTQEREEAEAHSAPCPLG